MKARTLAELLDGDVIGANRVAGPGPGHSRADRSMSVLITDTAPDGFVVTSFAGDDWRTCRDYVLARLGHRAAASHRKPRQLVRRDHAGGRQALIEQLWHDSVPINGTPAERYLIGRGLSLSPEAIDGRALRFHPCCPFRLASGDLVKLPAMIAAMVDIRTNVLRGIHRTALAADGNGKADMSGLGNPKKMLGQAAGACVKLCPDEDVSLGLHIAEGIETAIACMAMGFRPMWAALSAGGIAKFPVLAGIDALTVFADHDVTGMAAAAECASRWDRAAKDVTRIIPAIAGTDFADGQRP